MVSSKFGTKRKHRPGTKTISFDEDALSVRAEQVSLIVGQGFVFSFQERLGDVFEPVRDRLRQAKGRIRSRGGDYLAYALIDAIVAWGGVDACAARVEEHFAAGADHVCVQVLADEPTGVLEGWRELAPALLG